jgi:hypothetical protein
MHHLVRQIQSLQRLASRCVRHPEIIQSAKEERNGKYDIA